MTAYRFRFKFDSDPTSLWRDVRVGTDRTLTELQSAINPAFGLDQGHLWFIGSDEDYWRSDVKYLCQQEDGTPGAEPLRPGEQIERAGETTVGELADQLGLEQYDRICYLYDYGDEWRFYGICKAVDHDATSDTEPTVVKEKGDTVEQYTPLGTVDSSLPEPLGTFPETAIPTADLAALEDRDDIDHVISLLSIETGFGTVTERFLIQYDDAGYLLENYPDGWEVVEQIDGEKKGEEALLGELAALTREYHAEIAEMASAVQGRSFDEETAEAMNVELEYELNERGYEHL